MVLHPEPLRWPIRDQSPDSGFVSASDGGSVNADSVSSSEVDAALDAEKEWTNPPSYLSLRTSHSRSLHLPFLRSRTAQSLQSDLPEKPLQDIRAFWNSILPCTPSDDRRPALAYLLSGYSDSQKRDLIGKCFLWGTHLVFDTTQSNARARRGLYWGKFLLYGQKNTYNATEFTPGLYIDPWFHVTFIDPASTLPPPFRDPFSVRTRTRSLKKLVQNIKK